MNHQMRRCKDGNDCSITPTRTPASASKPIRRQFLARRLPTANWKVVRSQKEKEGFSRDAYEHYIQTKCQPNGTSEAPQHVPNTIPAHEVTYLILLEGILSAPEDLQSAANLPEPPAIYQGSSETEDASFCKVDGTVKRGIDQWLAGQRSFRPTYVRLNKAKKDLSSVSIHPTLGRERTLPQYRASTLSNAASILSNTIDGLSHLAISPLQDEYPIWYFFYGTLTDSVTVTRHLSLSKDPVLRPGTITGGIIKIRGGKYTALVEGTDTDIVHGSAFEVADSEQEEALFFYETDKYEVVRCLITMPHQTVQGLTFRLIGKL